MTRLRQLAFACSVTALTLTAALAQTAPTTPTKPAEPYTYTPESGQPGKDVVWVPTQQALVDRMLEMAKVTSEDYVIDLGSGDGRTVIAAAKRGARAHGIEYNPDLVALSKRNAEAEGVADRATFEQADIFASDFSKATVITLFLLEDLNRKLRPTLLEMKPGTRVVSNSFSMGDWEADDRIDAGPTCQSFCRAFKWIIPAKVAGSWRLGDGELKLTQTYQMLAGTLTQGGRSMAISNAMMNGSEITFSAGGRRYSGETTNGKIIGKTDDGREWSATR
jgi:SAM-dependent methyltransferase